MAVTAQTSVSAFVNSPLINHHAGSEEGEGVDEDGHDAHRAEQTKGAESWNNGGCAQGEGNYVGHGGHGDCHPRI